MPLEREWTPVSYDGWAWEFHPKTLATRWPSGVGARGDSGADDSW